MHHPPIDPSSLTRWRKRIGEEGVGEWLLTETYEAARRSKVVKKQSFEKVMVDATVMENAVAFQCDCHMLERDRKHLVILTKVLGIKLLELQPRSTAFGGARWPLRACQEVQANEVKPKIFEDASWAGMAKHRSKPRHT